MNRKPTSSQEQPPDFPAWTQSDQTVEDSFDIHQYFRILLRGKWLIIVSLLIALVLGAFQLQKATPLYAASATLKYDPAERKVVRFDEVSELSKQTDEIRTQLRVIQSPAMATRVIDTLGLDKKPTPKDDDPTPLAHASYWLKDAKNKVSLLLVSYKPNTLDPEIAEDQRRIEQMLGKLNVEQVDDTRVIRVTYLDQVPERAAKIADEYCQQYIQSLREAKTADQRYASDWLREQINKTREELTRQETQLDSFRPESGMQALEQRYDIALETMKSLNREIEETRNEIATLTAEDKAGQSPLLRTVLLAEDTRYNRLTERLRELELERISLVAENTPNHPDVRRLGNEITVLNDQITSGVMLLMEEGRARRTLAQLRLESLEERLSEQVQTLNELQKSKERFESFDREVSKVREVYDALMARSKEIDVTSQLESTPVTVLSRAAIPEYPSSPKIMRTIALFAIFGVAFGTALVLLLHQIDRSVRDPREIETRFGIPTLGVVPFLKGSGSTIFRGKRGDKDRLVAHVDLSSNDAESFRVLRTALQYSHAGQPPRVVMVTSCMPQEGKSTIASNLAASYATRGDRVLLIDADLKKPVLHRIFEKSRAPGLTDLLTGQQPFESVLMRTEVENLDLITAGPSTPSPADLLESASMKDLIESLRAQYTAIIIDSAPLSGMADSLVLSHATEGVCLVVNRGQTPRDALQKSILQLEQVEARLLGIIYNDRTKRAKLYGYGAGYGYGYGQDEERRESFS